MQAAYPSMTTDEIADKVGVTERTVRRYLPAKDDRLEHANGSEVWGHGRSFRRVGAGLTAGKIAGDAATGLPNCSRAWTAACLAKGVTGERSELTQVHFISITRDLDEITPLIDR